MPKVEKFVQENAGRKLEVADKVCTTLPPPQQAPWFVFFSHRKHQKLHTFVSLSEGRVYIRELEEMCRSYYYARCSGWLFMMDLSHRVCFLVNLLSKKKIMLPPPPRGSDSITSAVITSSPLIKGSSMILSYRRDLNIFLFTSLKEDRWKVVKCKCADGIEDLLKCNGIIYALTGQCELAIVDVDPYPKVTLLPVKSPLRAVGIPCCSVPLESCGELFLVFKFKASLTERLYSFDVYKMDFSEMKWVEVSSLGDRAFFLGGAGPGMSCSASRASISANCIYFVDNNGSSILKFDMADKSVAIELSWPSVPKPWADVAWINILES